MTVKQFFKSTAFKCIVTLLCVLLISGIFLTLAYGLLEVTEEEKFNRKVGNLYSDGAAVTTDDKKIEPVKVGSSTMEKLWFIPEKNDYLVQVSTKGRDGAIVTWVIVEMDSTNKKVEGVGTVLVYDKVASEYADKIPGWNTNIENFSNDYKDGVIYAYGTKGDPMYINTGASVSFTAISNSVNDAITYIKAYANGGSIEKSPLEDFLYTENINIKTTETPTLTDGKVTYKIKTKAYGASDPFTVTVVVNSERKIESFTIDVNGGNNGYESSLPDVENIFKGKDLSYFTGLYGEDMEYKGVASFDDTTITTGASNEGVASNSTYLCMYAGAFATANYENSLKLNVKYTELVKTDTTEVAVADGKVTYTIKTKAYGASDPFTVTVVVNSERKIESFTIDVNGGNNGYESSLPDVENIFKGKDLSYFTGLYGEDMEYTAIASFNETSITTGASNMNVASNSTYLCMYAAAYATANYDISLTLGGGANE